MQSRARDPRNWTVSQWSDWRDAQIESILTPRFRAGDELVIDRIAVVENSVKAYEFLRPMLADGTLLNDPARRRTLGNFIKFVTAEQRLGLKDAKGGSPQGLAMDISDQEYWQRGKTWLTFPPLLGSRRFLRALSVAETYKSAVEMILEQNAELPADRKWIVCLFRAQFILSVDKATYGRLLVVIPNEPTGDGRRIDKWISFAIETPDSALASEIKSVSMISVVRDMARPGTHEVYFADFMREPQADGSISIDPNFLLDHDPSKNCYDCHKSGVLPILPKLGYSFDSKGKLREEPADMNSVPAMLNATIPKYGMAKFLHQDPGAYGPTIGPEGLPRTDAFIRQASQGVPLQANSYARIRKAMNCARCHDPAAKINYPLAVKTDRDSKVFEGGVGMLETVIEKGYMPLGNTLTGAERKVLWRCLSSEYLDLKTKSGLFARWLKGR